MWQRKHRQYQEDRCTSHRELNNNYDDREEESYEFECWDNGWDDDLRESFCTNKNNMSIIEALKSDLECTWNNANSIKITNFTIFSFIITWLAFAF